MPCTEKLFLPCIPGKLGVTSRGEPRNRRSSRGSTYFVYTSKAVEQARHLDGAVGVPRPLWIWTLVPTDAHPRGYLPTYSVCSVTVAHGIPLSSLDLPFNQVRAAVGAEIRLSHPPGLPSANPCWADAEGGGRKERREKAGASGRWVAPLIFARMGRVARCRDARSITVQTVPDGVDGVCPQSLDAARHMQYCDMSRRLLVSGLFQSAFAGRFVMWAGGRVISLCRAAARLYASHSAAPLSVCTAASGICRCGRRLWPWKQICMRPSFFFSLSLFPFTSLALHEAPSTFGKRAT